MYRRIKKIIIVPLLIVTLMSCIIYTDYRKPVQVEAAVLTGDPFVDIFSWALELVGFSPKNKENQAHALHEFSEWLVQQWKDNAAMLDTWMDADLKKKCDKWKAETGLGFGLYGTPAESLCYKFARIDKERFGTIKDVTDKGYYTNSYHVDVRERIDAFEKLSFESEFQKISSGGAISYIEIPNMEKNLDALETVVKFIYDNIQYAEFNTKSDYCQNRKYTTCTRK